MKLEKMNVLELNSSEKFEVNGGFDFKAFVRKTYLGAAALYVIENWSDIKSGLSDGWKDASKP
jgi:hypothetical protein